MSMIPKCVVCDKPLKRGQPGACCEGYTCPKEEGMSELAPRDRIYVGSRDEQAGPGDVFKMDRPGLKGRPLNPRNDLSNHSPTGFQWGYGGSGPAQLALALLSDVLGRGEGDHLALKLHQDFKFERIAGIKGDQWRMTAGEIRDWIKSKAPPCFRWKDEETVQ